MIKRTFYRYISVIHMYVISTNSDRTIHITLLWIHIVSSIKFSPSSPTFQTFQVADSQNTRLRWQLASTSKYTIIYTCRKNTNSSNSRILPSYYVLTNITTTVKSIINHPQVKVKPAEPLFLASHLASACNFAHIRNTKHLEGISVSSKYNSECE